LIAATSAHLTRVNAYSQAKNPKIIKDTIRAHAMKVTLEFTVQFQYVKTNAILMEDA
jgi:hypothetical protein